MCGVYLNVLVMNTTKQNIHIISKSYLSQKLHVWRLFKRPGYENHKVKF